jgi:hypothetical protein
MSSSLLLETSTDISPPDLPRPPISRMPPRAARFALPRRILRAVLLGYMFKSASEIVFGKKTPMFLGVLVAFYGELWVEVALRGEEEEVEEE